jgi:hypothetical protein
LDKTKIFEKLVTNDDGTKFQGIKQTIIDGKVSYVVSADFVKTGILTSNNFVWDDKEKKGTMWDLNSGIFLSPNLQIDRDGKVTVTGIIYANEGDIGGFQLVDGALTTKDGKLMFNPGEDAETLFKVDAQADDEIFETNTTVLIELTKTEEDLEGNMTYKGSRSINTLGPI